MATRELPPVPTERTVRLISDEDMARLEKKFPGNSVVNSKPKTVAEENGTVAEPQKRRALKGTVSIRKPGLWSRITGSLTGEDGRSVAAFLWQDVLVHKLRDAISDIIGGGVDRILYGEDRGRRYRGNNSISNPRTNYGNFFVTDGRNRYDSRRDDPRTIRERTSSPNSGCNFTNKIDAERVLEDMKEHLREYGIVSLAELYDFSHMNHTHVDCKHGWTNLDGVEVRRDRDGWFIDLPRTRPI